MKTTACWRAVWTATLWIGTAASAAIAATTPLPPNPDVPRDFAAPAAQTASDSDKPLPEQTPKPEPSAPGGNHSASGEFSAGYPGGTVPTVVIPGSLAVFAGPGPWVGPGAARPPVPPPRIGFRYILIPGYGYKIVEVMPFSAAARMCLDYGDVILTLNGCPMTHHGADLPVRARAVATDGWVTAYIHDEHTGLLVTRSANLFGPPRRPPASPRGPGLASPGTVLPPPDAAGPPAPVVEQPSPGADQPPPPAKPAPTAPGKDSPGAAEKPAAKPEATPSEAEGP